MNTTIPLEKKFKIWLIEEYGISEDSSKSYLTYLRGLNKIIKISQNKNKSSFFLLLEQCISLKDVSKMEHAFFLVIEELSKENADILLKRAKKTLQNYKSALFSYLEFFKENLESNDNLDIKNENKIEILNEDEVIISQIMTKITYSKKDLISIFKNRVKTWDRVYENIFFPIQFVSRIYREQKDTKEYNKWIEKLIDSIIIYTKDSKIIFKEIIGLSIIDNRMYIELKDSTKLAYTKMSDNHTLEPFIISKIKNATIDHSVSLFDIMNDNIDSFPIITAITKQLKKHIEGGVTRDKLVKVSKLNKLSSFINTINLKLLLDELMIISSKTDLQLMKDSNNTSKGRK